MPWNTISMIILALVTSTIAKPVAKREGNFDRVEELTRLYPAIIWETAAGQCTTEDFNILAEAVRVANNDMLQPFKGDGAKELVHTSAFNKFFIRPDSFDIPFQNNWGSSDHLAATFTLIRDIFRALPAFMAPEVKLPRRARRIRYLCQPWGGSKCTDNVAAKNYPVSRDDIAEGPSTVFCPLFFDKDPKRKGYEYIQDIAKQRKWQPRDLPQIKAREHVVIHEMCHVDAATGRTSFSHITDLAAELPGEDGTVPIYGASRAHNFAWKDAVTGPPDTRTVNPATHISADNFAWVYTNQWMAKTFGWLDDGSEPLDVLPEDDPLFEDILADDDSEDLVKNLPDFTSITMPPNCFYLSEDKNVDSIHCVDMQGMTGDEWIAARDEPYESRGGCELSSQCKMPFVPSLAIDPACVCKCDGQITPLSDDRCVGFQGALPTRDSPPNGAPLPVDETGPA